MRILAQIPDFPDNRTNVARKLLEYQCTFRGVDPIKTCVEYVEFHDGKPEGFTENHLGRLHRFFSNREKWNRERTEAGSSGSSLPRETPDERRRRGAQRRTEGYEWLFGEDDAAHGDTQGEEAEDRGTEGDTADLPPLPEADPEAERLKEDLVACVSERDGRSRDGLFSTFVPVRDSDGRLALVCPNEQFVPYVRDRWGEILSERNVLVLGASEYADSGIAGVVGAAGAGAGGSR